MSISQVETFIRNAREQCSQQDINVSLLKATVELMRELQRIDHDVRSTRRNAKRRF